ncbi:MAG TPA: hypothetical protein VLX56_05740 [Nitrososphaerales archaeon]|nr:hypothetical protein [Nitrososphaerales archaeon]
MTEIWDKKAVYLSIVLALASLPLYLEGVIFQNVYIILAGDLPLFAAATQIWRVRVADKKARAKAEASTAPGQRPEPQKRPRPQDDDTGSDRPSTAVEAPKMLELPEPPNFPEVGHPDAPPSFRDRFPILDGPSAKPSLHKAPIRTEGSGVMVRPKKAVFRRSPQGMKKPAFVCKCGHVHATTCMTCGMNMSKALKSRGTKWTEFKMAKAGGTEDLEAEDRRGHGSENTQSKN